MLEGLKVVELATYIAAPGAGGIMADWGASVVKVEPPGGDPIRQFFA
jgi:crotonobetainyl-CoA:carnitine CoA-transferase CaiB-like acyl-CoA transferase